MTWHPRDTEPAPPPSASPSSASPSWRISVAIAMVVGLAVTAVVRRNVFDSAALFVLIIVGLVVAHEFAHFVTAKLFGVYVHEFGIGFPPRLWARRFGETEYSLNLLPIGGFVRLMGEEDPGDPRSLAARPRWQRLIVLTSGAVVNLLLPIVLFAVGFMLPHAVPVGRAKIASVVPDSPAVHAGLQANDVLYTIGGRDAKNVTEAGRYIRLRMGRPTEIAVRRGTQDVAVTLTPRWSFPSGQGPTGIEIAAQYPFTDTVRQAPWTALGNGVRATWDTLILARNEIVSWAKGGRHPQVAGPVAIAQTTGEVAKDGGIPPLFELAALISVNLGIMNLLPLPMLDGGRVLFVLIEIARRGRRIAPEKEALVHTIGFVAFMMLAIVVTFADISRIIGGGTALP